MKEGVLQTENKGERTALGAESRKGFGLVRTEGLFKWQRTAGHWRVRNDRQKSSALMQ